MTVDTEYLTIWTEQPKGKVYDLLRVHVKKELDPVKCLEDLNSKHVARIRELVNTKKGLLIADDVPTWLAAFLVQQWQDIVDFIGVKLTDQTCIVIIDRLTGKEGIGELITLPPQLPSIPF